MKAQTIYMQALSPAADCPLDYLPTPEWENETASDFVDLRWPAENYLDIENDTKFKFQASIREK